MLHFVLQRLALLTSSIDTGKVIMQPISYRII